MNNDFSPKKPDFRFRRPKQPVDSTTPPVQDSHSMPEKGPKASFDLNLEDVPAVDQSTPRLKSRKKWLLIIPLILVILLVSAFFYANNWYKKQLQPRTADDIYHIVEVQEGSSVEGIAKDLEEKAVIKNASAFEWYVKLNKVKGLQAGAYRISSKQPVSEIVKILEEGRVTTVDILIPPGRRLDQIIKVLEDAGYSESEVQTGLKAVRGHQLLANLPKDKSLEGYIFPDTYKIGVSTTVEEILNLALDNFRKKITSQIEAGLAKQNLTLEQAIILASIVQMEEKDPVVQKTVSQVFLRRLREKIPLGADPTFKYAAYLKGESQGNSSVNIESPYNTRVVVGLPPTAIANFNITALEAVANPSATNYLFFVAEDGTGIHHFSNTQAEHEALTRKYCQSCFQ